MKNAPIKDVKEHLLAILNKYALESERGNSEQLSILQAQLNEALSQIKSLDLTSEKIDSIRVQALAVALQSNNTITNLDLSMNPIGAKGLELLSEALSNNRHLTKLKLIRSDVSQGIEALAQALQLNNTLTHLELANNDIDDGGALSISNTLKVNHTLAELNLDFNKISENGGLVLAQSLKVNNTINISMRSNALSKNDIDKINALTSKKDPIQQINYGSIPGLVLGSTCAAMVEHLPLYWVNKAIFNYNTGDYQRFRDMFKNPTCKKDIFKFDYGHYYNKCITRSFRYGLWHIGVDYVNQKQGTSLKQQYPEYSNVLMRAAIGGAVGAIEPAFRPVIYLTMGIYLGIPHTLKNLLSINIPGSIALFGGAALVNKKLSNEDKANKNHAKSLLADCIGGMASMVITHPMEIFACKYTPKILNLSEKKYLDLPVPTQEAKEIKQEVLKSMTLRDWGKGMGARTLLQGNKVGFGLFAFEQFTQWSSRKFGEVIPKREVPVLPPVTSTSKPKIFSYNTFLISMANKQRGLASNPFDDSMQFSLEEPNNSTRGYPNAKS